ncbi:hypothetical protein LBBP_02548 [Leptospira borgpetersenii serovar Ballum]|uniref:Uncharacterized protein n=1 Tax=Leptospira borgpetersenii serovar Ballum TaxID=280505 RepID=A0A0S2ISZ6_LEPBO|nr:hypothetical protein LBBP_02548 [Leptospira borgpetersenii serovar Ballum]
MLSVRQTQTNSSVFLGPIYANRLVRLRAYYYTALVIF